MWLGCSGPVGLKVPEIYPDCLEHCELSALGEGCDTEAVIGECPGICDAVASQVPKVCADAYQAVVACEAEQSFVCTERFDDNGVTLPALVGDACEGVEERLHACTSGAGP